MAPCRLTHIGMCERGSSPSASLTGWPGSARRGWFGLAVSQAWVRVVPRQLVLLDNAGGDAAAAAQRYALVFRPGPDVRAALPAGGSPLRPVPLSFARLAGVFDVEGELLAESTSAGGVQADLVVGASDPEPHRLIRGAASRSSSRTAVIFVAIVGLHAGDGLAARYRSPAMPRSSATRRPPPLIARCWGTASKWIPPMEKSWSWERG
jgi:hypothetical protein